MGISKLFSGFVSTPGKVITYVQENILRSPDPLKRRREGSIDDGTQDHRHSRLKLSPTEPDDKAASRLATVTGTTSLPLADEAAAGGEVVSPPAPWLHKQKIVQAKAHRHPPGEAYRSSPAVRKQPDAAVAQYKPLELWSSIRARRHGPQTGFRPFHSTATPAAVKSAASPVMVRSHEAPQTSDMQSLRQLSQFSVLLA